MPRQTQSAICLPTKNDESTLIVHYRLWTLKHFRTALADFQVLRLSKRENKLDRPRSSLSRILRIRKLYRSRHTSKSSTDNGEHFCVRCSNAVDLSLSNLQILRPFQDFSLSGVFDFILWPNTPSPGLARKTLQGIFPGN